MKILLLLIGLVLVAGCTSPNAGTGTVLDSSSDAMAAENGNHVFVHYTGTLDNGTVFDSSEGREPLEFDVGSGQLIRGFDAAVLGMKESEEKTVTIKPEDAYGYPDPGNIVEIPRENIPEGTKTGDTLYAEGRPVTVVEVRNDTVVIDANHPLAGKNLTFRIKLVKIEKGDAG